MVRAGLWGGFYDKLLARIEQSGGNPALVACSLFHATDQKKFLRKLTDRRVEWLLTEMK